MGSNGQCQSHGTEEFERAGNKVHDVLGSIQEKFAFLPDYSFKATETAATEHAQEKAGRFTGLPWNKRGWRCWQFLSAFYGWYYRFHSSG